jgi:hypothetical protein
MAHLFACDTRIHDASRERGARPSRLKALGLGSSGVNLPSSAKSEHTGSGTFLAKLRLFELSIIGTQQPQRLPAVMTLNRRVHASQQVHLFGKAFGLVCVH